VRLLSLLPAIFTATLIACGGTTLRTYGQYDALGPRVSSVPNERVPLHVNVELPKPANVAVFFVIPGRASMLLFPEDSTRSAQLAAGTHQLTTSFARQTASADSARNARRLPTATGQPPITGAPTGGRTRRDSTAMMGMSTLGSHGFLLVFASEEPLSYSALSTKVAGISIPIDDTEALNTVAKLARETTRAGRPWAAFATEFNP
jgi:hypothetical protein